MKILLHIALNLVLATMIYFGLFGGVSWAANLAYFLAWFSSIVLLFTLSEGVREEMCKTSRTMPRGVDLVIGWATAAAFAAVGSFVTATVTVAPLRGHFYL